VWVCLPNLPNEIFVALISSGLNLCCFYFIGVVNCISYETPPKWHGFLMIKLAETVNPPEAD
jgi:hypothetical protein